MDTSRGEAGDVNPKKSKGKGLKAKSCKGYLFYSAALKSQARNPRCFGISRTLPQVPRSVVSPEQTETLTAKDGQNITDFSYSCLGYSMYLDGLNEVSEEMPRIKHEANTRLPVCSGLQVLVGKQVSSNKPAPAQAQNEEDNRQLPLPQRPKPTPSVGDDFMSRFTKNAGLVASGVARDLLRMGSYIKSRVDDIIHPDRRRPK
ncbi:hypothetical protein L6164_020121 [Bauhinia variegata]|uniref:Uncharacterized protein n=1 Tax=Bauhinia variegata TaxID=167791 RepID=A0ACB9MXH3_BAUVA|nr:hypothetical protein L6164_020121 [Bauhinia variegata]